MTSQSTQEETSVLERIYGHDEFVRQLEELGATLRKPQRTYTQNTQGAQKLQDTHDRRESFIVLNPAYKDDLDNRRF